MVMVSHAHQGHTRSRRRDEHHQMSMLVVVRDSLSWPWDAEKKSCFEFGIRRVGCVRRRRSPPFQLFLSDYTLRTGLARRVISLSLYSSYLAFNLLSTI